VSSRQPQVIDSSDRLVALGGLLGEGGEGAVFDVKSAPHQVAKIYHKPLERGRAEKILLMSALANDGLRKLTAWPIDLLRLKSNGLPIGLIVPKVHNAKDIHQLYGPKSRRAEFQRADWRFLIRAAANVARAFGAVHSAGFVIGDVNHGGVLAGQDATVTLIDCDSFQVEVRGRRFLCTVGVETFTPPELQGKSFEKIVRTANHDDFGLAVMIFLLLFMGRHPFSGRFSGPGDMPIGRAIEEGRFAYGQRRAAMQMAQPPGTPSLSVVGPQLSSFFERAFARETENGGRPTASEWIKGLQALESTVEQCSVESSHWHYRGLTCPWCPMEGVTGIPLFPSIIQTSAGSVFDLTILWRQVETIAHPGPIPSLDIPAPAPTRDAARLRGWSTKRQVIALTAAALTLLGATVLGPVMVLAAVVVYAAVLAATNKSGEARPYQDVLSAAESKWQSAERDWTSRAGPVGFDLQKAALVKLREEWNRIPNVRLTKLDELERHRERVQRERFLDQFEIEKAKIKGIGKGRTQTLASFGIETAADVTPGKLSAVPGFGPKMRSLLLVWRASVERGFRFDPTKQTDPRDIARVEQEVLASKKKLEGDIISGVAKLRQAHAQIMSSRQHMRTQVESVKKDFLQAKANYDAVK
jgi:DNA-binding helix-hairpin-helix protein with protein kinase domain